MINVCSWVTTTTIKTSKNSTTPKNSPGPFVGNCLFHIQPLKTMIYFLFLQFCVSPVKVTQLCPTLCDPIYCTVHGILQARILEWVAIPFSRGSSQPRDQILLYCRRILYQLSHKGMSINRITYSSALEPGFSQLA